MSDTMNFSEALKLLKEGKVLTRVPWLSKKISIRVAFPGKDSLHTEPFISMSKAGKYFPSDISCESIFAEDWLLVD